MDNLTHIDLHITNRCNLGWCSHCNVNAPLPMDEISGQAIMKFLETATKYGAKKLHITGGEPFMREDLLEILRKSVSLGYKIELVTNGTLLTDTIFSELKDIGIEYLAFSLDGDTITHDKIRKEGDFNRILNLIKKAKEHRLKVRVNTAVLRENKDELGSLLNKTIDLGVDKHVLFYFTPIGRGANMLDSWLTPEEWIDLSTDLTSQFKDMNRNDTKLILQKGYSSSEEEAEKSAGYCKMKLQQSCVLMCDGNVFPCILFMHCGHHLGNIIEEDFEEIWTSKENWERYLKVADLCKTCSFFNSCNGGCKGYSLILEGNLDSPDPRCNVEDNIVPCCPWETIVLNE